MSQPPIIDYRNRPEDKRREPESWRNLPPGVIVLIVVCLGILLGVIGVGVWLWIDWHNWRH